MARKPAHLELVGGRGPRQRVWEAIRKQRERFSAASLEKATLVDTATIRTFLQSLGHGGFIAKLDERKKVTDRQHYELARDIGVEAPRIDRKGNMLPATGTENMWRTMRIVGAFTPAELAVRASNDTVKVAAETAKSYAHALAVAGYLTIVEEGHPFIRGKGAKQTKYQLLPKKYTGPRPPMVQRTKCLYDPNLGEVVWQEEPDRDAC